MHRKKLKTYNKLSLHSIKCQPQQYCFNGTQVQAIGECTNGNEWGNLNCANGAGANACNTTGQGAGNNKVACNVGYKAGDICADGTGN